MSEFDPSANGHRDSIEAAPPANRGSGVLLLTLVSALTGLNLLIGAGLGTLVSAFTRAGETADPVLIVAGAGLGAALGVTIGVRVALRFGGSSGLSSSRWLTGCGLVGLAGSVAVAGQMVNPFAPFIAIVLPGFAALMGDRIAARRHHAKAGTLPRRRKLKDQEAEDKALDPDK